MELITAILALNPIWVIVTIIGGLAVGLITKDIKIDKRTVYALLVLYLPFAVSRLLLSFLFGIAISSGSGYIGVLFFNMYLIALIIGRRVGNALWK